MNQKIKKFDSVQLMRKLRDQLSEEMAQMSPEERIHYIQRKAAASPLLALFSHKSELRTSGNVSGRPVRPNGPGERSPGLRPKADALGKRAPHPCDLKGREKLLAWAEALTPQRPPPQEELERLASQPRPSNAGPTVSRPSRPHRVVNLSTQGIGLRPQPWAPFSRPVGPDGPTSVTSCSDLSRVSRTAETISSAESPKLTPSTLKGDACERPGTISTSLLSWRLMGPSMIREVVMVGRLYY